MECQNRLKKWVMASGSEMPLRGPGPLLDCRSCLHSSRKETRPECPSALDFQWAKSCKCFASPPRDTRLPFKLSAPTFLERIADMLSQSLAGFLPELHHSKSYLLTPGHQLSLNLSSGVCTNGIASDESPPVASKVFEFSRDRHLESEPWKIELPARSSLVLPVARETDREHVSHDREWSCVKSSKGPDCVVWLFQKFKRACCASVVSDLVDLKNANGHNEIPCSNRTADERVSLSSNDLIKDRLYRFRVVLNSDEDEKLLLALPDRLEGYQILKRKAHRALDKPMVCLEGASRAPARGTVKGWEVIKIAIERALGQSILPAREVERMHRVPLRVVAGLESKSNAYAGSGAILQRSNSTGLLPRTRIGAKPDIGVRNLEQSRSAISSNKNVKEAKKPAMFSLRMGDNALAGALAGTCVSLCLHPVDTVKTVIQAHNFGQRSIFHTFVSIVSDRGVSGLYRGLGSNLASSAPISAIYTFTYESVKAALVPRLPKEYHALAHCAAGGCASFATSFVYTPSECVKQRMQVGSLYRNSWLAFWSILQNGGLPVLYSGWQAVLYRNVPQSIIKFYTYERMKHYALDGYPMGTALSTLQTLAFGGLAGSTAALFTTPFDVIKTRLQTQASGSLSYQKGVLHAFRHIAASEGVGGLYRGLIPRLVIYVSQGALFFASYELFKRVISVEVQRVSQQTVQPGAKVAVGQPAIVESI